MVRNPKSPEGEGVVSGGNRLQWFVHPCVVELETKALKRVTEPESHVSGKRDRMISANPRFCLISDHGSAEWSLWNLGMMTHNTLNFIPLSQISALIALLRFHGSRTQTRVAP